MIKAIIKIGKSMKGVQAKWGIAGDAGEVIGGVNIHNVDRIEIWTTKDGCEEMCRRLSLYVTLRPASTEKKLGRDADVNANILPVFVRCHYAELSVDRVKVEVYGDQQIKVGEWDWGDALDFEPDSISVVGVSVPFVPLMLKSELDLGLGWLDRVQLISDAVMKKQHSH